MLPCFSTEARKIILNFFFDSEKKIKIKYFCRHVRHLGDSRSDEADPVRSLTSKVTKV